MKGRVAIGVLLCLAYLAGCTTHSLFEGRKPDLSTYSAVRYQEKILASTVEVLHVDKATGSAVPYGSGVVLDVGTKAPVSFVMTAKHVIEDDIGGDWLIGYWGTQGPATYVPARVYVFDADQDLSILRVDKVKLPGLEVDVTDPKVDSPVLMTGFPSGVTGPVNSIGFVRYYEPDGTMVLSASVWYGYSGSGLVSLESGKVVGIMIQLVKHAGWGYRADGSRCVAGKAIRALLASVGQALEAEAWQTQD